MKKQLTLLGLLALIFSVSSCQKEKAKAGNTTTNEKNNLKVNTLPSVPYVDLALIPRNPGENYDTYYANFHGSNIYVIGPAIYDQAKYPTLVNGVPCFGQSMYSNNQGVIDYQNTGTDGNVFEVSQGNIPLSDYTSIHTDLKKYFKAQDDFNKPNSTTPQPNIFDYVKSSYPSSASSNGFNLIIHVGKLIRVTTGTHWAVTEINYPLPAGTTASSKVFLGGIYDTNGSNKLYHIWGVNGVVTTVNFNDGESATGTYSTTSNSQINTVSVTIIRNDGTKFVYSGNTVDLS